MEHYVYVARIGKEVMYVGKGVGNRYKHITSGTSHCYEANKAHFSGADVSVVIEEWFNTDEEALSREAQLIKDLNPVWNFENRPATGKRRGGKGVQFKKPGSAKPWCAYINIDYKKVHLGYFTTEEEAQKARQDYT